MKFYMKTTLYNGEFRFKKAQAGIPKHYVIIKIEQIRARFREFPDLNSMSSFNYI